jgi:hypothetical protein
MCSIIAQISETVLCRFMKTTELITDIHNYVMHDWVLRAWLTFETSQNRE